MLPSASQDTASPIAGQEVWSSAGQDTSPTVGQEV